MPHHEHEREPGDAARVESIGERLAGGDPGTLRNVDGVVELVLAKPDRVGELITCVARSGDDRVRKLRAEFG